MGISQFKILKNRIILSCPIHNGDNPQACCLYIGDNTLIPNWKCFTHKCEEYHGKSLLSFVSAIIGKNKYETTNWLKQYIEFSNSNSFNDQIQFIQTIKNLDYKNKSKLRIPRQEAIKNLIQPVQYYINRNFSSKILNTYDIGVCLEKEKEMFNRIVVPIYNASHTEMIGCVGRSLYEECYLCNTYHDSKKVCPPESMYHYYSKWKNNKGFFAESYFYNYWFAINEIQKTKTVFLVEGQSDVWRFAEIGIKNVLGMFGSSLKHEQKITLEKSGVQKIITYTDPDLAGELCRKKIEEEVGRLYDIDHIIYHKDPSDCLNNELFNLLKGKLYDYRH